MSLKAIETTAGELGKLVKQIEQGTKLAEGWNLVAAGPSRKHLRPEHLLPNAPVVTVNRSIDVAGQGIHVDFAAFADGPGGCWEPLGLEQYLRPGIQLWVTLRNVDVTSRPPGIDTDIVTPGPPLMKLWDRKLPAFVGLRPLPHGSVEDESCGEQRHAFTTMCAWRRILMFQPIRIRVLCMDMAGSWVEGKTAEECLALDMERTKLDRWKHERRVMEREIETARKNGIFVDQVTPRPE